MTSKKKAIILIIVLSIALLASVASMIVVIVASTQTALSTVNVKYTSSDVYVQLSAKVYIGDTSSDFTTDATTTGNKTLILSPTNMSGTLSQPNNATSIDLTRTNSTAVFEYVFTNLDEDIDVKIELTKIPGTLEGEVNNNLNIYYAYSDTQVSDVTMLPTDATTYSNQLLPAYTGEDVSKYIYIIAQVDNLLDSADLLGTFEWNITRPETSEVATYTLNLSGVDMVERSTTCYTSTSVASTMEYKTMTTAEEPTIDVVPLKSNAVFVGWATTSGATTPETITLADANIVDDTHNAIRALSSKTLYPVYKTGTVPSSSYSYSNGEYTIANTKITSSITNFVVPDIYNGANGVAKVTKIADGTSTSNGVMNSNTSVKSITLGRYLTSIGKYSFYNCTNVTEVNYYAISVSTLQLSNYVFYNVGSNGTGVTLTIGKDVSIIPYGFLHTNASYVMNLKSCIFEDSDTPLTIGGYAFWSMKLASIDLPDRVVRIDSSAFEASRLESLNIPKNVNKIGNLLTYSCLQLASITVDEDNIYYDSRENCNAIVETATNKIIAGCKNSSFPSTITTIGGYAFSSQTTRTSLTIPSNIKTIEQRAFRINSGLESLTIAKGVTIEQYAFEGCTQLTAFDVKASEIGAYAFKDCTSLKDITLYSETIGESAFVGCTGLTNVTFAYGVEEIGVNAFYGCTNLTSVTIPGYVKTVGNSAFYDCTSLTTFIIESGVVYLGEVFIENTAVTSLYIPSSVTSLGRNCNIVLTSLEFEDVGVTWRSDCIFPEEDMYWLEPEYLTTSSNTSANAENYNGGPGDYFMWVKQS